MKGKLFSRLISILLILVLSFSLAACSNNDAKNNAVNDGNSTNISDANGYAEKLFDTSYVHTIDITISEDDWNDLTENPLDKTKYEVNITIDGETIESVSFATKGNTSLTSVAGDADSVRYSFKVNFGKYNKEQTYYGLNKLNLNNIYADATYMKDYLSYEIFRQAGVDSPLVSYVWLTINGEDHGLYIAIEDISEGYLNRVCDGEGELYKPETEQLANMGQAGGIQQPDNMEMPENGTFPDGMTIPESGEMPEMPRGGGNRMPGGNMGFGSSSGGANLAYIDDEISRYSDIFDNDETDADDEAKMRVISALKGLSEGNDLENYLNTEEIIRYFVAHNFVLNYDSYTGNMLHNYYLYENDGKLSMLPWDYNLAFGGFSGNGGESGGVDTTSLVNTGIDTPLSGVTEEARPMWNWIVSNENYLEIYHSIFDSLISCYFESGKFESEIDSLYEMLYPYVEKDPSAFYSADEFTTAYKTMKQFCLLRAESIRLQLNGNISTKSDEQESSNQVDASGINIRSMGSQGGGREDGAGGFGNMPQMNIPSMPNQENNSQSATPTEPDK
ncbi:MAG: CotH kinase family protein [Lachnospira sp.]